MNEHTEFIDPLDELMNRIQQNDAPTDPVQESNSVPVEEDEYGKNDLANEIAAEEAAEKAAAERRAEELRQAQEAMKPNVIMPPDSHDKEFQAEAVAFQADVLNIVGRMIHEVCVKNNITSGEIPVSSDTDPDLRRHVMGDLIECYHEDGEVITPRFEKIVLDNWSGYVDPSLVETEKTPESNKTDSDVDGVRGLASTDNTDNTTQINVNISGDTPVNLSIDKDLVGDMTQKRVVNVVVSDISVEELKRSTVIENSQMEGIIKPYESNMYDVPITLPASGYRCVLKPMNMYEYLRMFSPSSGTVIDEYRKQWSVVYNHVRNASIGEFTDFEDFLKKTKSIDLQLLLWGLMVAVSNDDETISITCGNKKCRKVHVLKKNPRELIHIDPELAKKCDYQKTHDVAYGKEALDHFNKINSIVKRYKLPHSGYIVEVNTRQSAYDFLNRILPLTNELTNRFYPNGIPQGVNPDDNSELSYLIAHATVINAISIIANDKEYRYTTWEDIEKIITESIGLEDSQILISLTGKLASEGISPIEFYVEDFTCPNCGRHDDRVYIPDMFQILGFRLSRMVQSTEISLIEMPSN